MKKWYKNPLIVVTVILVGLSAGIILINGIKNIIYNNSNKINDVANDNANEIKYQIASYILEDSSKEKIDKIIVDSDTSLSMMQDIYEKRKLENSEYKYTIWFFSSKEKAQGADTYELGFTTDKNGEIEIVNVKEEKEKEEELKEQERKEKEARDQAKKEEKKYKNSCKKLTFEELARNPEKIRGNKVKLTGEVIQVSENDISIGMRVNITKNEYGWYEDTVYIIYYPEEEEDKILEDDIITIYGTAEGEYSYTSIMGAYITIPKILAEYIEIN